MGKSKYIVKSVKVTQNKPSNILTHAAGMVGRHRRGKNKLKMKDPFLVGNFKFQFSTLFYMEKPICVHL